MNSRLAYSALQLALLGVAPVLFLPFVARALPTDVLPKLMLTQAWISVLSVLVQYGLHIQGPVDVLRSDSNEERWRVLSNSWRVRSLVFALSTAIYALLLCERFTFSEVWPLLGLLVLPMAFWGNAGWYLQALGDFRSGALGATLGVLLGVVCLLLATFESNKSLQLLLVIGALSGPQVGSCFLTALIAFHRYRVPGVVHDVPVCNAVIKGVPASLAHLAMVIYLVGGTIVVAWFDDSDTLSAYAATEKLFNVMSVALVLIYSAQYPKLAERYTQTIDGYWTDLGKVLCFYFSIAGILAIGVMIVGPTFFGIYLGQSLAFHVIPVLPGFALWLALSVILHAAVGHIAISGKRKDYTWLLLACLVITFGVGCLACTIEPTYWIVGLLAGQFPPIIYLYREYLVRNA